MFLGIKYHRDLTYIRLRYYSSLHESDKGIIKNKNISTELLMEF